MTISLIHTWPTSKGNIQVHSKDNGLLSFSFETSGLSREIREIISSFPLSKLKNGYHDYFQCTHARLVELSDGSLKLYLNPRILGGMLSMVQKARSVSLGIPNLSVSDQEIENNIRKSIPSNTYTSVSVVTDSAYRFVQDPESMIRTVRVITVDLSLTSKFSCFFRSIASSIGVLDNLEQTVEIYRRPRGGSSIKNALFGLGTSEENDHLTNSFIRATSYRITIDVALEFIDIESITSNLMLCYHALKEIRYYTRDCWSEAREKTKAVVQSKGFKIVAAASLVLVAGLLLAKTYKKSEDD